MLAKVSRGMIQKNSKTPQSYERIEFRLNALDIKLADVLHALKKYPVQAIEDGITYTQKKPSLKLKLAYSLIT